VETLQGDIEITACHQNSIMWS